MKDLEIFKQVKQRVSGLLKPLYLPSNWYTLVENNSVFKLPKASFEIDPKTGKGYDDFEESVRIYVDGSGNVQSVNIGVPFNEKITITGSLVGLDFKTGLEELTELADRLLGYLSSDEVESRFINVDLAYLKEERVRQLEDEIKSLKGE